MAKYPKEKFCTRFTGHSVQLCNCHNNCQGTFCPHCMERLTPCGKVEYGGVGGQVFIDLREIDGEKSG